LGGTHRCRNGLARAADGAVRTISSRTRRTSPRISYGAGANYRRHVIELIVDRGPGGLAHLDPEARYRHAVEIMDHRAASGKPFVFVAPRGAIAGPDELLQVPYDHREPDWELELAVVIGTVCITLACLIQADPLGGLLGCMIATFSPRGNWWNARTFRSWEWIGWPLKAPRLQDSWPIHHACEVCSRSAEASHPSVAERPGDAGRRHGRHDLSDCANH
jgi:hypothetical protein